MTALVQRTDDLRSDRYDTLAEDYAAGATIRELAERYGVSYRSVWEAMVRRGIPRRPREVWREGRS